jgi:tetratricopeptide (TPR) repeat protein
MATPGGVATVGVHLTEAGTDGASQDVKVAVVRLRIASRPGLMEDARAWRTLGFACYDARRYEQALAAFERMERQDNADRNDRAMAVIWQGHMLDLLGRRQEAIARYRKVADMGLESGVRHDQYGLAYKYTPYARERMTTPFIRVENLSED